MTGYEGYTRIFFIYQLLARNSRDFSLDNIKKKPFFIYSTFRKRNFTRFPLNIEI